MKRRLFLPLHLFILFATLLAAGCWCPRADAHEPEKGAFRHAPTQYETVIQDVYHLIAIYSAWDFHLKAGSPALNGAAGASESFATPLFGTTGLTINGENYTSPAVQSHYGAYGE